MKSRNELLGAMEAIQAAAVADNRGLTAEEQVEFDRLDAEIDRVDAAVSANAVRASRVLALRGGQTQERLDRLALRPDQSLASLNPRAAGDNRQILDMVRAQLGLGASQSMGTGSAGGFTVPDTLAAEVLDLARAQSRLVQAGARIIPVTNPTSFATIEGDPSFAAHGENASIDETSVLFGQRNFRPVTRVALVRASVELFEDSANAATELNNVLAAAGAVEWDRLGLTGNGIAQPLGLLNDPNVHVVDGSAMTSWTPFSKAVQAVSQSNYQAGAFITSPGGVGAIDRLADTTGQPLARPPSLQNTQFLDTTSIPAGNSSPATTTAITGDWSKFYIALRTGMTIEATRTGGDAFSKMSVLVRCYFRFDAFAVRPAAFARITGLPVSLVA